MLHAVQATAKFVPVSAVAGHVVAHGGMVHLAVVHLAVVHFAVGVGTGQHGAAVSQGQAGKETGNS